MINIMTVKYEIICSLALAQVYIELYTKKNIVKYNSPMHRSKSNPNNNFIEISNQILELILTLDVNLILPEQFNPLTNKFVSAKKLTWNYSELYNLYNLLNSINKNIIINIMFIIFYLFITYLKILIKNIISFLIKIFKYDYFTDDYITNIDNNVIENIIDDNNNNEDEDVIEDVIEDIIKNVITNVLNENITNDNIINYLKNTLKNKKINNKNINSESKILKYKIGLLTNEIHQLFMEELQHG